MSDAPRSGLRTGMVSAQPPGVTATPIRIPPPWPVVRRLPDVERVVLRISLPLLRVSLGLVYVWFGALKLTPDSPVAQLVAGTVPFLPAHLFVPALGVFEMALGLGLLVGKRLGIVAFLVLAHLAGTFLVLVIQPQLAFQHGNPLELTMTGEFVMKNIVLMSAGLVLATVRSR